MNYTEIIVAVLGTGLITSVVNYFLFRRKHKAEVDEKETDNEIKLYDTLNKRNKDQDEIIGYLSDTLKTTRKELVEVDLELNKKILALEKKIDELLLNLNSLKEENEALKDENNKLKNGECKQDSKES